MPDFEKDTQNSSQAPDPVEALQGVPEKVLGDTSPEMPGGPEEQIGFILDIPLEIRVELGRTRMQINELLKLGQGSVIELGKSAGENLEILANNRLIAKGEVVVTKEKYGIRLTEIISPMERVETLR